MLNWQFLFTHYCQICPSLRKITHAWLVLRLISSPALISFCKRRCHKKRAYGNPNAVIASLFATTAKDCLPTIFYSWSPKRVISSYTDLFLSIPNRRLVSQLFWVMAGSFPSLKLSTGGKLLSLEMRGCCYRYQNMMEGWMVEWRWHSGVGVGQRVQLKAVGDVLTDNWEGGGWAENEQAFK